MTALILSRLHTSARPAAIHLLVSFTIALLTVALIFLVWYPRELANAQGVSRLVLILIGVDVALGPLITLIVFNPAKKHLWFDLTVIAALQTAALLYGMRSIADGRPAYVVFSVDRFDVVARMNVDGESLRRAAPEFAASWFGPRWFAARLPEDRKKRSDILFSSLSGGADVHQMPENFVTLEAEKSNLLVKARPMDELRKLNGLDGAKWQALLDGFVPNAVEDLAYLPLVAKARDGAVIVHRKTGEVIGIRMLTPSFSKVERKP